MIDTESRSPNMGLQASVTRYHRKVKAGAAVPETVSLRLRRTDGFLNRGEAGSGHPVIVDEPADFGGRGSAADPAELLLAAIGASLSVTITAHAALRSLPIEDIDMELSGWMDPAAFFNPDGPAPSGLLGLRIDLRLRSPAPLADLEALVDGAARASPVVASLIEPPVIVLNAESAR